ncbi:MAG: 1,4-dihydroxy-2-naphthoate polyprenyltransferase [Euzebyaceae bacterium]|nr:1,4-dihydroxy-2-naphthoate polyprenyltransferase [Euzebyaceae bacterium]
MHPLVEAARPKTLSAGVAPVLVGTAAADRFVAWRFAAALVVGVAVQVGVNYANDYFDFVRGVDTPARVGPRRAVAAGLVAPARMRLAMLTAFGVAAVAGLALAAAAGWELLLVGALCFAAAVGYSGGPRPYASAGLGELFVFTFFGLVATVGSAYVQEGRIVAAAVAAAVPVGLLAVAILVVNNLRDIETDAAAGKQTLAARIGDAQTRTLYVLLLAVAFASVAAVASAVRSPLPVLAALAAPLAAGPLRVVRDRAHGRGLIPALAGTARLQLVFGVLLALGLALA